MLTAHHPGSLIDTGAPIEPPPAPRPDRRAARARVGFSAPKAATSCSIYGGSQGSLAINRVVARVDRARACPTICPSSGEPGTHTYEQFKHLEGPRVRVRDYLAPIAEAYAAADLALVARRRDDDRRAVRLGNSRRARAAADGRRRPSDDQRRRRSSGRGAAIHIPQSQFTVDRLDATVRRLLDDPAELARLARRCARSARARRRRDDRARHPRA